MNDVSALFEIFPICQKFLLNTIDIPSMDLTKTQILILFALSGGRSLNMSQLSSYLASSKEQATRAVSPLVKDEYVTRFRSDENRKMVYVKLTEKGNQLILQEKALVKEYLSKRFESLSKEDQELFHLAKYAYVYRSSILFSFQKSHMQKEFLQSIKTGGIHLVF